MTASIPPQPLGSTDFSLPVPASRLPVSKSLKVLQASNKKTSDPPVLPPDQWQNQPVKTRRFGDQQIRLLNNVLELVETGDTLLKAADQNNDQKLSREELAAYRPAASESAEIRFSHKALQGKLMQHFDAIDSKKDGLDTQDLEQLRLQALGQSTLIQTIGAVPVKEMHLQESIREMPALHPYTLSSGEAQNYSFESRFQPLGEAVTAEMKHLEVDVQRHQLELPSSNHRLLIIQGTDPLHQSNLPTPQSVAEAVSALPDVLQKHIQMVELNPLPYTFEVEGNKNPNSADMTASPGGKITIYPRTQPSSVAGIYRTLIHESAHLLGFEKLGVEGLEKGWSVWKDAMAKDEVAPSEYARRNGSRPGIEDFAEAVTAWVLSQGQPEHEEWRALMPARFALLDKLLTDAPLEF